VSAALGDRRMTAIIEHRLAVHARRTGDRETARALLARSLEAARALRFVKLEAQVLGSMAAARHDEGNVEEAFDLTRRSAELAAACGFTWWQGGMLLDLVELDLARGRVDDAERWGREALSVLTPIDDRAGIEIALAELARVALSRGDLARAGLLWGAVDREVRTRPSAADLDTSDLVAEADPLFASACEEGRTLELAAAIALALGEAQTFP